MRIELNDILRIDNLSEGRVVVYFNNGQVVCSCPEHYINREVRW